MLRLFLVLAIPLQWLLTLFLIRRVKWLAGLVLALGIGAGSFALLPGRPIDPARLRAEYVRQLRRFEGTWYLWGGENGLAIDCSGLVRRALIDAYGRLAISTANAEASRRAFDLWWHDCSARALRDGYRDFTRPAGAARSINSLPSALLRPGDLAVTADGVHVLAYLGHREWIAADPDRGKVVICVVPAKNPWFAVPVQVRRWTALTGAPDEPAKAHAAPPRD